MYKSLALFVLGTLIMGGCAGYRAGSIAGKDLQGVNSVFVPTVRNLSLEPGLHTIATNAIIHRFDNDGTLKTTSSLQADSELTVVIKNVRREGLRGNVLDTLAMEEYEIFIEAEVTFLNRKLGKKTLDNVQVVGSTKFFVQSDQVESERQAMPLACADLAKRVVSLIVEGW